VCLQNAKDIDADTDQNGGNAMNPRSSNNLSKSLLIAGCGVVPLTAFLFQATPILILTVSLSLLSLFTVLLILMFLLSMVAVAVIGIEWLWTMFDDDRHQRRYWRTRRILDLEERKPTITRTRPSRSTDPSIPVSTRQLRPPLRRPNTRHL